MQARCPACGLTAELSDASVPDEGVEVICARCGHDFFLRTGAVQIWVLADDPALRRPNVQQVLRDTTEDADLRMLSPDHRQALALLILQGDLDPPDVLVFGDLTILIQDPVLQALRTSVGIQRILVSTHFDSDLLEAADSFCEISSHLVLPDADDDLRVALSQLLRLAMGAPPILETQP